MLADLQELIWKVTLHDTVCKTSRHLAPTLSMFKRQLHRAGQVYKKVMAGERPRNLLRVKDDRVKGARVVAIRLGNSESALTAS